MNEETPIHHYPNVQGMHQVTQATPDAWETFFSACWDAWEIVQERRKLKAQTLTEPTKIMPAA